MEFDALGARNLGTPGSSDGDTAPFSYILIPIIIVGLVTGILSCWRFRRRRRVIMLSAPNDPEGNPRMRTRVDRGPNGIVIITNGEGGGGNRGRRAARRLGLGVGSREEGLNELGEAPPAYAPDGPKPGVENVELREYSQAVPAAAVGTSANPPEYDRVVETAGESSRANAGSNTSDENDGTNPATTLESQTETHTTTTTTREVDDEGRRTHSPSSDGTRLPMSSATDETATAIPSYESTAATSQDSTTRPSDISIADPTPPPKAVLPSS